LRLFQNFTFAPLGIIFVVIVVIIIIVVVVILPAAQNM